MADCNQQAGSGGSLSVNTRKITDSCQDKDCIEDLRVYLSAESQAALDNSVGARVRCADLLYSYITVEPVAFDRNRYCVNCTFYYRILADTVSDCAGTGTLNGLAVFNKQVVLCGEDCKAHVFSSDAENNVYGVRHPTAVVEVLDPMVLSSKVREACGEPVPPVPVSQVPPQISRLFDGQLVLQGERKRLYVTLGQFSIVRLERDAQVVVPVVDYSIPGKTCCDNPGCAEDPCEMFSRIPFPAEQFNSTACDGCGCRETPTYTGGCNGYTTA